MASSIKYVVNVKCTKIEKRFMENRKHEKLQVYFFAVSWSDGSNSEIEKTSFSVQDFLIGLKQRVYKNHPDVSMPELPAPKRFEIRSAAKKEEKNRKAVDEFCQQILKLPEAMGKREFLFSFFASCDQMRSSNMTDTEFSSADVNLSAGLYAEINDNWSQDTTSKIEPKKIAEVEVRPLNQSQVDDSPSPAGVLYAQVNKERKPNVAKKMEMLHYADLELASSNVQPQRRCTLPPSTLYAEIDSELISESRIKAETLHAKVAAPRPKVADELFTATDQSTVSPNEELNENNEILNLTDEMEGIDEAVLESRDRVQEAEADEKSKVYENSSAIDAEAQRRKNLHGRQFYRVLKQYIPNVAHSQGLAVEEGDIVQVQCETEGRMLCTLANRPDVVNVEGWLPSDILQLCKPDFEKCSRSIVLPVVQQQNVNANQTKLIGGSIIDEQEANPFQPALELQVRSSGESTTASIPVMPSGPAPCSDLPVTPDMNEIELPLLGQDGCQDSEAVYVVAVADFTDDGVLSFRRGTFATLVYASSTRWWCVRMGSIDKWVPSTYWRIYDTATGAVNVTTCTAPWMVGEMKRAVCDDWLMRCGQDRDFVVRESTNLARSFAISIRHADRVRHFPIVLTADGRYLIGKHHFTTILNVIIYYKRNYLFHNENETGVKLGNPLLIQKNSQRKIETDVKPSTENEVVLCQI